MRKTITAISLALGVALTGCATTDTTSDEVAQDKSGANAPEPSESSSPDEEPEEEQGPLTFGEAMEWEDGLWLKISKPKPIKFDEWAAGADKYDQSVWFAVKVVNNTGKSFDVSMFSTSAQSGNEEASEVFASGQGFEGSPTTKLLDGRESQFKIAYNVQNPKDIVMDVTPDWEHESITYVTK